MAGQDRRGAALGDPYGTIHDSTPVDCSSTSTAISSTSPTLQPTTLRNRSPSRPASPTAAAPIARFCGDTIFASTPPELLAAAISVGDRLAFLAAATCSAPNSEFVDVSDPVTAVPNQPMIGDRKAKKPPAPAAHVPSVIVCPDRFITY